MIHLLITIIALVTFTTLYSQNKEQLNILDNFIITHNDGSDDAIKQFIKDTYLPEIYATINYNHTNSNHIYRYCKDNLYIDKCDQGSIITHTHQKNEINLIMYTLTQITE